MQFQVPQFIDNETLLLGPLTVTQSGYIGGGVLSSFLAHGLLGGSSLAWMLSIFFIVFALALSFFKIEGITLPKMIYFFFSFLNSSKIYLWEMTFKAPRILKLKKNEEITIKEDFNITKNKTQNSSRNPSFQLEIKNREE